MGKIEMRTERMYITLLYWGRPTKYIVKKQVIFKIPASAPDREKIEILDEQILLWLVQISNVLENYDEAIKIVEKWLKDLIYGDPGRRVWVEMAADSAGEKFQKEVNASKLNNKTKAGHIISANLGELFRRLFR